MSIPQSGGGLIESHDDLVNFFAEGSKPRENWKIGTEHEKFGYCKDTLKPLPYEGDRSIKALLEGLQDRFGWDPVFEGEHLIGLTLNGANISLEPGGQLELSGAPLDTIHQTCDEVNEHLREVQSVSDDLGARFIGLGMAPHWTHDQMPLMPKGRYKLMDTYMGKVGTTGTQMMRRTCTVQVNLDFSSEADMVQKFRTALALQPVATALFANSPFMEGKLNGHKSWRSYIWRHLDASRTGMLPFVFEDGMSFERYTEYALDVPMYFVYRDGKYIDALGMSFRDFLKGKLPALPGEKPTLSDWADHLTTLFPEARIKQYMEMRGADGGPWRRLCALPAFWVGLMYDQNALDATTDLIKGWTPEFRENLRVASSVEGLQAEVDGVKMLDLARECVSIAEAGLKARACPGAGGLVPDETHFLNALKESIETGHAPADELIEKFEGEWNGDVTKVFGEYSY
ncbi:MAG: glutamate--cysteine ligase [Alphaproteobacteria bacterium]|nr:glutamate--cysteine ligase [Alphaproteobacteria bacterium]MBU2078802.1 glutamate--cysteine ligase [Alphaproteobacteria bacterium]MBU2160153.1 glutamate--cysteine ligase [Alphaproteobacteria bacterium]MBU2243806.1 glutamate--cysteine ligase [Alphaproteobacteria bacterium]